METATIQEIVLSADQFSELLAKLDTLNDTLTVINNNLATVSNYIIFAIVLFAVYFIAKLLYGLFGHVFFGGI